jgi:hypothetical protein
MNRKEWREVGRQSLFFILALAAMALLLGGVDLLMGAMGFAQSKPLEGEKLIIILGAWWLMFSMFLGLSPFAMDSKQKGMEYLLTLPYSRRRLLLIKLLPRLAAAVFFYLAYALLYFLIGNDVLGGGFILFSLVYFAIFFISFSFSVIHENFIVQAIWAGIALCGYLAACLSICALGFGWKFGMPMSLTGIGSWRDLAYDLPSLFTSIVVFLLLAAPFVVSLFLAFKKFDLKPARAFNRRHLLFFVPLFLLALGASLGITHMIQKKYAYDETNCHILANQQILKASSLGNLAIYSETGRRQIKTGRKLWWEWILFEVPRKVFILGYDVNDSSTSIIRLQLGDLAWKVVYSIPYRVEATTGSLFRQCGHDLVFLQRGREETERSGMQSSLSLKRDRLDLVLLDMNSERSRTISFRSSLFPAYINPYIFAYDETGGRSFWLSNGKYGKEQHILRLWEDGVVEDLGVSKKVPAYFGHLLFSNTASSLVVRRLLASGSETIREIEGKVNIASDYFISFLDTGEAREIYGKRNKRIIRIDLATLAIDDVGPERGQILRVSPVDFYYVEHEAWLPSQGQPDKWRKVFRLQGGKAVFLRKFNFNGKWPGHVWMQRHGVVLIEEGKTGFFAFPDLRELKCKGFN